MRTRIPANLILALSLAGQPEAELTSTAGRAPEPSIIFLPRPEPSEPQRQVPGQLTPGRRMTGRKARRLKRRRHS